jgi:hypothetical protein
MAGPTGEADRGALRLDFDRSLLLQFRRSVITSDAGLLAYCELDDALGLTDTGADTLGDARTGKNGRHRLAGLLRRSVFGRLPGYDDVNDAKPGAAGRSRRRLLQQARYGGALDQRGQGRDRMDAAVMPRLPANAVRLQLHVLAYNLGNFMRTLAMPKPAEPWSLTSLRAKLIKIGAKVVSHGRYVTFQLAEVAVSRQMFADILSLIARMRASPAPA